MRRLIPGSIVALVALTLLALALLLRPRPTELDREPVEPRVRGDVEEVVTGLRQQELLGEARALLATDRPWRAARTMERYLEEGGDPPPDHLLLAARAQAGWGGWPEARPILEGFPALEAVGDGLGLYLLGRARDEAGEDSAAVAAYRAFLSLSPAAGALEPERDAARLRLGLALLRQGRRDSGTVEIGRVAAPDTAWLRILRADALAATGDTAAVRELVTGLDSGVRGLRAWRARILSARAAGDLGGARTLANRARAWARTTDTKAELLLVAARLALEMGDTAAARDAFRGVIDRGAGSDDARLAADLLQDGDLSPADHLAVARVQAAQGLHEEAIDGYRRWLDAGGGGADRADVHVEHATALFYAGRYDDVPGALRPVSDQLRARLLLARAEAHRDRTDEAVRLYLDLARDRAGSGTGTYALFVAAGTLHDAGRTERARELYRQVVERYPGSSRMGLAMMRLAGMAFEEGDYEEAGRIWDRYRSRYPRGDRALQATYWAGRARQELGDSAAAAELFRAVRERERDSYYALLASRRLGEPFWPLPMDASPAASPEAARTVDRWLRTLDLLRQAGFPDEAAAMARELEARVGGDRARRLALAEALAERGYSRGAIRLGLSLDDDNAPSARLLRVLFPFPYRTLITEEARDRGLDPFIAAALIRQESMFEARITSPAGARGLMQIMPATGRRLAEAAGMERWDADLLYRPEINTHLGIRLVAQHMDTYDGSLPAVFSAYNAGPHRVEWWSEFPEYGREELFTERIPYSETRGYVKILTRNRALYRGLYGSDLGATTHD